MAEDRSTFGESPTEPEEFNPLLKKKKKAKNIDINGEFDFSSDALGNPEDTPETQQFPLPLEGTEEKNTTKRGRPVSIKDKRYKVNRPKMISAALESKLATLQDYVEEFQDVNGRITFEKYIDTLTEFYITQKLGIAKEEHLRDEIREAFDQLKK